ncbi:hypothetical protein [Nocardiopsis coralliicola]
MIDRERFEAAKREILIDGLADWPMLVNVADIARDAVESADWRVWRDLSLELLGELTAEGLVEIGSFTGNRGFRPWDVPFEQARERIVRDWEKVGADITHGDVCWVALTEAGCTLGERYEAEEPDED